MIRGLGWLVDGISGGRHCCIGFEMGACRFECI